MKKIDIIVDMSKAEWKKRFLSNIDKLNEQEDLIHEDYQKGRATAVTLYKGIYYESEDTFKLIYIRSEFRDFNKVFQFRGRVTDAGNQIQIDGELEMIPVNYWEEIKMFLPIFFLITCVGIVGTLVFHMGEILFVEILCLIFACLIVKTEPMRKEGKVKRKMIKKMRNL